MPMNRIRLCQDSLSSFCVTMAAREQCEAAGQGSAGPAVLLVIVVVINATARHNGR